MARWQDVEMDDEYFCGALLSIVGVKNVQGRDHGQFLKEQDFEAFYHLKLNDTNLWLIEYQERPKMQSYVMIL